MTHITHEDLEKLAKLSALNLSEEEKTKLLPQLENIIGFVWQLQECDVSLDWETSEDELVMKTNTGLKECISRESLLKNVSHPTDSGMIELETSTNQS